MAGKLIGRLLLPRQLRADEETCAEVHSYAEHERRDLTDELRHIIDLGLERKRQQLGEETVRLLRQLRSTPLEQPGPMSTPVTFGKSASRKMA